MTDTGFRVGTMVRRQIFTQPPVKPCPVCYAPMQTVDGGWECLKHGFVASAAKKKR